MKGIKLMLDDLNSKRACGLVCTCCQWTVWQNEYNAGKVRGRGEGEGEGESEAEMENKRSVNLD